MLTLAKTLATRSHTLVSAIQVSCRQHGPLSRRVPVRGIGVPEFSLARCPLRCFHACQSRHSEPETHEKARFIGYRTMRLDTLAFMVAAIRLYEALGFVRCAPYYDTPLRDTVFMELRLT